MHILFIDIETAQKHKTFDLMPEAGQLAFTKKLTPKVPFVYETIEMAYEKEAALYAEFSEIICIGVGMVGVDATDPHFDPKTGGNAIDLGAIAGEEVEILIKFSLFLERKIPSALCAHNGKIFDYPFIARRYLANRLPIPPILNTEGKKPWECVNLIDTLDIWRFGDMKYYVSLITLAYIFNVPSPKDLMEGKDVPAAFHDGRIEDIKIYNMKDIVTLINIYRAMRNQPLIYQIRKS